MPIGNDEAEAAAPDDTVPSHAGWEAAQWIVANTDFERLSFYGGDQPIHVSVGPEQAGQVVTMPPGPSGQSVPRTPSLAMLLAAQDRLARAGCPRRVQKASASISR